jgi:RNA polymerase sigma-70 factor (ECF subfamily)
MMPVVADGVDTEARIGARRAAGDAAGAATLAIRGYGSQILGYLRAVLRDDDLAAEAFARFGEAVWKGLPKFRGESSVLTWCYGIALGEVRRARRDPFRRRGRRLETSEVSLLVAAVTESTSPSRASARDAVGRLRATLSPDDQTLLILRIDRDLAWKDVVEIFAAGERRVSEPALRKRFERVKARLRRLAAEEGLIRAGAAGARRD